MANEALKTDTVALGEDITHEERIEKGRNLASRLCGEKLTHCWGEVGHGDLTVSHPFSQASRGSDVISCRDV